jgi:hypothetical protein
VAPDPFKNFDPVPVAPALSRMQEANIYYCKDQMLKQVFAIFF